MKKNIITILPILCLTFLLTSCESNGDNAICNWIGAMSLLLLWLRG